MAAPGRGMRSRSKTTGTVAAAPRDDRFTAEEDAIIVSALRKDGSARGVDFEDVARALQDAAVAQKGSHRGKARSRTFPAPMLLPE